VLALAGRQFRVADQRPLAELRPEPRTTFGVIAKRAGWWRFCCFCSPSHLTAPADGPGRSLSCGMPTGTTTHPVLSLLRSPTRTGPVPQGDSGDRGRLREVPALPSVSTHHSSAGVTSMGAAVYAAREESQDGRVVLVPNNLRKIRGGFPPRDGAITASWAW
jgi:hypothetical protein